MRGYTRLISFTTRRWYMRYATLAGPLPFSSVRWRCCPTVPAASCRRKMPRASFCRSTAAGCDAGGYRAHDHGNLLPRQGHERRRRRLRLGGASPKGDLELRRATVTVLLDKLDHSLSTSWSTICSATSP